MKHSTIFKKIILMVSLVGLIISVLINLFLPNIVYHILRPNILQYLSSFANANALRLSYIWSSNANNRLFMDNSEMQQLFIDYYGGGQQDELRERIIALLPDVSSIGAGDSGAIPTNSYFIAITDQGDFFYHDHAAKTAQAIARSDWYQNYLQTGEAQFGYIPIITDTNDPQFRVACKVTPFFAGSIRGFFLNTTDFQNIQDQFQLFDDFGIDDYLIYSEGRVCYRNLGEVSQINLDRFPAYMFEGVQYETKIWENQGAVTLMTLTNYPQDEYRVAVTVTRAVLLRPYRSILTQLHLIITGLIVLLIFLFLVTLRGLLKRIVALDQTMERVRSGDYAVTIVDSHQDEIGRLANTFTMMLAKIKEDMSNAEKMQYLLMVSAIDPHYIYNTLNTVTVLARMGRNEDVVQVNTALIATLKDRMRIKNYKIYDTVERERDALEQYMVIQRYLTYQDISLTIEADEEDLQLMIPKNIIQPLVENSIKHGILCNGDENGDPVPGIIRVSVRQVDGTVQIDVEDNGAGMSDETLERFFRNSDAGKKLKEGEMEHVGIYNVLMRLNYLYMNRCQFTVNSRPGQGTAIRITLPIDL